MAEAYLRPIIFVGDGAMGLYAPDNPVRAAIVAWKWGTYLGDEALALGIRTKVSSLSRLHVNVNLAKAKISGQYVNSILAKREAKLGGYERGHPARHERHGERGLRREHLRRAQRASSTRPICRARSSRASRETA